MLELAKFVSENSHKNQIDKAGIDYFAGHIQAVVNGVTTNKEKIVADLDNLKGFFRKTIGSQLSVGFVPEIRIHIDDSVEYGVKISSILNEIKQKDSE